MGGSLARTSPAGEVIHSTDGGRFVFDHHDHRAPGGPEAVYRWVAASGKS